MQTTTLSFGEFKTLETVAIYNMRDVEDLADRMETNVATVRHCLASLDARGLLGDDAQARTVRERLAARKSLHEDLTRCGRHMVGTEWYTDRVKEMEWANKDLVRLGVIPVGAG